MGVDLVAVGDAVGRARGRRGRRGSRHATASSSSTRTAARPGAVLLGDTRGHELLLEKVRRREPVDDPLGLLAGASEATAADLPDTAQVCNCNGVCKGEIVAAIRDGGLGSTQEVVAVTRAGAGCGSCKPLVKEILALERGGAAEEPAYLCPCRKQTREQLAAVVRERDLESVSELARRAAPAATAAPASRASPTSSRRSTRTATARSATRASSTTASTRTSRTTAPSRSSRASAAA